MKRITSLLLGALIAFQLIGVLSNYESWKARIALLVTLAVIAAWQFGFRFLSRNVSTNAVKAYDQFMAPEAEPFDVDVAFERAMAKRNRKSVD